MLLTLLMVSVHDSYGQKKSKKERRMEQFAETQQLIDSKQFTFIPSRAFPQGGRSIDLTTNYGHINVMAMETEGIMPFFGRGFTVPYGGDAGIRFKKTAIENEKVELNEKKMRITYSFEAKGENDVFRINMDVSYNGYTSVSIISNNRSQISYSGEVSPLEKKSSEDEE